MKCVYRRPVNLEKLFFSSFVFVDLYCLDKGLTLKSSLLSFIFVVVAYGGLQAYRKIWSKPSASVFHAIIFDIYVDYCFSRLLRVQASPPKFPFLVLVLVVLLLFVLIIFVPLVLVLVLVFVLVLVLLVLVLYIFF